MKKEYKYKLRDQVHWAYIGRTVRIVERKYDSLLNVPVYGVRDKSNRVIRWVSEDQFTPVEESTNAAQS